MDLVSRLEPSVVVLLESIHHRMEAADRQRALRLADPSTLTRAEALEQLQVLQRERAQAAAREAALLVALAGRQPRTRQVTVEDLEGNRCRSIAVVDESVDLIAAATSTAAASVRRRLAVARALHVRLPRTRARLEAGTISPEHAEVVARLADGLPASVLPVFETRVLRAAVGRTPAQTAAVARRLRARLDRLGERRRRDRARRHVDVHVWAEDDGLACVLARLPIADAARLEAAIEARSGCVSWLREDASRGERRAAALVEAVCGPHPAGGSAVGVEVQVTVDLATLVGLGDQPATIAAGGGTPEPMTAGALRDLLSRPDVPLTMRRLVTDPLSGDLLDLGRTAYRVSPRLRHFLVARDGTCRFPGCSRRASGCDVDHGLAWAEGGRTDRDNLACLCRRHHVLKTHGGWNRLRTDEDGTVVWRGPDGGEYVGRPRLDPGETVPYEGEAVDPVEVTGADPPF